MSKDDYAKIEVTTFVYVMGWMGKVKIGISRDPEKRLRQLQLANPGEVRILHLRAFSTRPSAAFVERALHKKFAAHRLLGEWFDIPADRAVKALDAQRDRHIHHKHWHPNMPFEIGAAGALERWKWHRSHDLSLPA